MQILVTIGSGVFWGEEERGSNFSLFQLTCVVVLKTLSVHYRASVWWKVNSSSYCNTKNGWWGSPLLPKILAKSIHPFRKRWFPIDIRS